MQVHTFDSFEIDPRGSEETLRFAFARKTQFDSATEFLASCPREGNLPWKLLDKPLELQGYLRCEDVRVYLERFACSPESISTMMILAVLSEDWNDLELLLESPERYFWFHWDTTA